MNKLMLGYETLRQLIIKNNNDIDKAILKFRQLELLTGVDNKISNDKLKSYLLMIYDEKLILKK